MYRVWLGCVLLVLLGGCTSTVPVEDLFGNTMRGLSEKKSPNTQKRALSRIRNGQIQSGFQKIESEGTGAFVSRRAPKVSRGKTVQGKNGYSLNLVNAPIKAAAENILGQILGVNYVVDPKVSGTVSVQTGRPVSKDGIVDAFEAALALSNAAIVQQGKLFRIVPLNQALASGAPISVPSVSPSGPGTKVHVIELQFTSAEEMKNILEPMSRAGSIVRVDNFRNHIVVAGTDAELSSIREAVKVFDLDWMRGMSVAVHPLKASQPEAVANELKTVFAAENGPGKNLIRFIPNSRLNAVLVITSRPVLLNRAQVWINKLDRLASTNDEQLFVYQIQNRPAKELADVLQSILKSGNTAGAQPSGIAPDLERATVEGDDEDQRATVTDFRARSPSGFSSRTSVVADLENNALLISTSEREYRRIELILRQLDVLPTQVLIEAVIAEVTLTDELKFGLRWAVEKGNFRLGLSDLATGFAGPAFPGFSWGFATPDVQVTLNALNSITDVNVISSPTLMALNNQKAILQVGDQVPIVTQTSTATQNPNAPVINSVELKDTGIILTIVPRVNKSGRVMLKIDQEASSVVQTTTSGIDSPTIQQRKISTRVAVSDGQTIALGGLIQERNTLSRSQVPVLGDVPYLGNLFKNKTDTIRKTELIIFVRPRVVRNVNEARRITEEFRGKLRHESAIKKRRGGRNSTEQNYRRLKY